jgi:DUF2075 family protein
MIVYQNSSKGFLEDVTSNQISNIIKKRLQETSQSNGNRVSGKEEDSWSNSMIYLGNVLRQADLPEDCGVLIEYNLPSTRLRIDFIISGYDIENRPSFIIIELKQWKEAKSTTKDGLVYTDYFGGRETTHPSYQAYSYMLYLKDFNENIPKFKLKVYSCAYLHNYTEKKPEPLKEKIYSRIINESPLFLKNDQPQLVDFIKRTVGNGKGLEILNKIEQGNIRPSKKLVDYVGSLLKGNQEFVLLDEQKVAFETAKEFALTSTEKTIIIINGGPGTGKSVVALNLLGEILKSKTAFFIAPNSSFRGVMTEKLTSDFGKHRIKHLLKGSGAYYAARKNLFDVLIVDEAHRLKDGSAFMYKGDNQVEDIINAGKVCIFFIDEKQVIRPNDIGTIEEITRVAKLHNAKIQTVNLTTQFRCAGAEGYVNWVDDILQIESTGNFEGWDKKDFEFRIFDNPNDMRAIIKKKVTEKFEARMLAGYAWKWTPAKNGNYNSEVEDVSIPEFDFAMPWNSRSVGTTWAIDESGLDQVGCIHTSQGLEFDYVGLIVGKDLQFNSKSFQFFTPWGEYKDSDGKKKMRNRPEELNRLVRNIYRVLLTRARKGCYVYFMDKEMEQYVRLRLGQRK